MVAWEHEFKINKDVVGLKLEEMLKSNLGAKV